MKALPCKTEWQKLVTKNLWRTGDSNVLLKRMALTNKEKRIEIWWMSTSLDFFQCSKESVMKKKLYGGHYDLKFVNVIAAPFSTRWDVITVKNKCLIMISTISVMALRYAIVPFQCDVLICYLVLVSWHYAITFNYFVFRNVLICHSTLVFGYYTLLFCHCILVFFNFDIGKSSFAVVIGHFHRVRFIMVFCQGNMQFGMTLSKEFWTR